MTVTAGGLALIDEGKEDYAWRLARRVGEKVIEECNQLPGQKLPGAYWYRLREHDKALTIAGFQYERNENGMTKEKLDALAVTYLTEFRKQVAQYRDDLFHGRSIEAEPGDWAPVRGGDGETPDAPASTERPTDEDGAGEADGGSGPD